jgi:dTMP kinase
VRGISGEEHVRVQRLLTRMAAAEPHRYVVVDADGSADDVAERVYTGLQPLLPALPTVPAVPADGAVPDSPATAPAPAP